MQLWYIVKGQVTDSDAYDPPVPEGTTEWQFSDGLPGRRSTSHDYLDLAEGIEKLGPAGFVMVPDQTYYAVTDDKFPHLWRIYDEARGQVLDGTWHGRTEAERVARLLCGHEHLGEAMVTLRDAANALADPNLTHAEADALAASFRVFIRRRT